MRVNTADCAARVVGAFTTEIGDQLSASATDAIINGAKYSAIRRIIIRNPQVKEPCFLSDYRKEQCTVKVKERPGTESRRRRASPRYGMVWFLLVLMICTSLFLMRPSMLRSSRKLALVTG